MLPAISSAVSGLRTATVRLEHSARTIANATSRAVTPVAGVNASPVYLLVRVDQTASATPVRPPSGPTRAPLNVSPAWMAAYETTGPAEPDLTDAALGQATAENAFIANARVLETAQAMVRQLFELTD
jgi:flagellar basal body rod protein FlgC